MAGMNNLMMSFMMCLYFCGSHLIWTEIPLLGSCDHDKKVTLNSAKYECDLSTKQLCQLGYSPFFEEHKLSLICVETDIK